QVRAGLHFPTTGKPKWGPAVPWGMDLDRWRARPRAPLLLALDPSATIDSTPAKARLHVQPPRSSHLRPRAVRWSSLHSGPEGAGHGRPRPLGLGLECGAGPSG